ncbi:MAG: DMT family transporter, partial [Firmicutes bacterium]|nr:DMT family transporter [Bacillota bacterium]
LYSGGFFGFQFFGLLYASSVEAGIIMAAQPALTMILAELAIKEKPTKGQRVCVFAAILAAAFISAYGSGGVDTVDIRGIALILLSTLSLSANVVYIRWIRNDYTPAEVSFVSCLTGFVIYTIAVVIYGGMNGGLAPVFDNLKEPGFVIAVLYLGVACTMLTTLMNSYVMKYLEAVKGSVIGCIGTVITLLAGAIILDEELGIMQIVCSVIILLSVIGTNYLGAKDNG